MSAQNTSPVVPLSVSARAALAAIRFYQRRLSPLKGFRCAHSVLHGGPGCSGFAAQAVRDRGLFGAFRPIRQRFRDCRAAFEVLKTERQDEDDDGRAPEAPRKGGAMGRYCPAACAGCDLGAMPGGAACGGASAGAEAAGGVCSAVSCCN